MQVKPVITLMCLILAFCAATLAYAQGSNDQISDLWKNDRYIDHKNGTVTDTQTGLMWKRCSVGRFGDQCTREQPLTEIEMNWKEALEYARDHSGDNYKDWRLPNIKELLSLVAYNKHSPAINKAIFPNTPYLSSVTYRYKYWSSSAAAPESGADDDDSNRAWYVNFREGRAIDGGGISRTAKLMVRLVRDK